MRKPKPWQNRFFLVGGESPERDNVAPDQLAWHVRLGGDPTPFAASIAANALESGDGNFVTAANGGMLVGASPLIVNVPFRILRLRWALRFAANTAPTRTYYLRLLRGETSVFRTKTGISWVQLSSTANAWKAGAVENVDIDFNTGDPITCLVRAEQTSGSFHNGASINAKGSTILWMDCVYLT